MQKLVIKIEDGSPAGSPILLESLELDYNSTPEQLKDAGYATFNSPVIDQEIKPWEEVVLGEMSYNSETVVVTQASSIEEVADDEFDANTAKVWIKNRLADVRWKKENMPITSGDELINTDRLNRTNLVNMHYALANGMLSSVSVKTYNATDGSVSWLDKSAADIEVMLQAVWTHVNNAFIAESTVSASIDALSTKADITSFDVNAAYATAFDAL